MKQSPFRLNAIAALCALGATASAAETAAPVTDVVVVSATRVGNSSFDMPAAANAACKLASLELAAAQPLSGSQRADVVGQS